MLLYLFRHGIAVEQTDADCPADPDRWLTDKGKARTKAVAIGLDNLGVKPAMMYSSPYLRARQSAEIVADVLDVSSKKIRITEALLPSADPVALFDVLQQEKFDSVMCFGHAPNLDEIVGQAIGAVGAASALKKAGVACIDMIRPLAGMGTLEWLYTPKVLRVMGKAG